MTGHGKFYDDSSVCRAKLLPDVDSRLWNAHIGSMRVQFKSIPKLFDMHHLDVALMKPSIPDAHPCRPFKRDTNIGKTRTPHNRPDRY